MKTVFNTAMVAHVWAQGRQESGRTPGPGRVFFEGPRLFSYGRHFLTAYRLPDGAAFLNSSRYSVSTARHQSDARRAIRGRVYPMPGALIDGVADTLESLVFRVESFVWPDGFESDSPYGHDSRPRSEAKRVTREGSPAELARARARLLKLFLDAKETAERESIVAALHTAGAKTKDAYKAADSVIAAHEKRAKKEAEEAARQAKERAARDAKEAAARPLSDFAAAVQKEREDIKRHNWRGAPEQAAARLLGQAKRLYKARAEARARGWTRVAADLKARESILRKGAAGLDAYSLQVARLRYWGEKRAEIRAGLRLLALPGGPSGMVKTGGYDWQQRRQAAEALLKDVRGAALYPQGDDSESFSALLARAARVAGADLARMAAGLESIVAAFQGAESRAYAGQARATRRAQVAALKAWKRAGPEAPREVAEAAAKAARPYARVNGYSPAHGGPEIGGYTPKIPGAFALAGFTAEAFRDIQKAAQARATAAKMEEQAAGVAAWRDGTARGLPAGIRDDGNGGALIRARAVERDESGAIVGGILETSQGASVPLTHALRAFRFLKLCRESGKEWRANGKTLPVGHFRVDMVDSSGGFRAGCHRINWPEVAALAARLGVAEVGADDTTEARAHA